ncbi:hypothetical protein ACH5RR_001378 [Cinchona calisaya]|uniref:Uncharacterized protein n=1 Tax=Cinchona calisaya TaxID=153742 RepID=A0ABD3B377_9GENT
MELSVICDVKACIVVFEPNEKKVKTWPENPETVREIINLYEDFASKKESKNRDSEATVKAENLDEDSWLMRMSEESIQDILRETDLTIEVVAKKIDFLKRVDEEMKNASKGKRFLFAQEKKQQK